MTSHQILLDIQSRMLIILKEELPPELSYHSYEHTLDVLHATEQIAKGENVSLDEMLLLKTAAVFHDMGYIHSRVNHEQKSCMIARKILASEGIPEGAIEKICELILATQVPQNPKDLLGQIICDADLDYLGRDDYFPISQNVFTEFKYFGILKDAQEWKKMQIKFLESHQYFTKTANSLRNVKKEENLLKIKNNNF